MPVHYVAKRTTLQNPKGKSLVTFPISVVQWHQFFFPFLGVAPLKWSSPKRVPFSRVTEELSHGSWGCTGKAWPWLPTPPVERPVQLGAEIRAAQLRRGTSHRALGCFLGQKWPWLKTNGIPFWGFRCTTHFGTSGDLGYVNSPAILEPILVGIGMFTGGSGF